MTRAVLGSVLCGLVLFWATALAGILSGHRALDAYINPRALAFLIPLYLAAGAALYFVDRWIRRWDARRAKRRGPTSPHGEP